MGEVVVAQPGGEIAVQPSTLVTHANRLAAIAGDVATAKAAGDGVRVDSEAYGKLCTIVPILLNSLQDIVLDAIDAAQDSLHDTGDRLRTAAQTYRSTDAERDQVNQRLKSAL